MDEMRIILLGKTGSGKSSLGNTIFGKEIFIANDSANSVTTDCKSYTKKINGKSVRLFDTPGVFDTDPNSTAAADTFYNCVKDCAPGPHAFLLVLKVERYTKQEQDAVKEILKCFSAEALKYTTVVFTHGDQLDKGKQIEDWYKENEALRSLVQKCGGRCHVIDNKYWNNSQDSYKNNQVQVTELLRTIEETVEKNGGGCYTNDFWQHVKYKKINGVPLKYLLAAALGVATAAVGTYVLNATAINAVGAGVVAPGVVGAGVAYKLAPDEVGAAASRAVNKVMEMPSAAGRKMTEMVSTLPDLTHCMITGNKPKTS